jgi:hypothetical protein
MTMFRNVGDLFDNAQLEKLNTLPAWKSGKIEQARHGILEALAKLPEPTVTEEGGEPRPMDRNANRYYWVTHVLRALGYCASVAEMTPSEEDLRPDFTLFQTANDFRQAKEYRGQREFFAHALALVRVLSWGASMEEQELGGETINPAFVLDRMLRVTGVEWGMLTNGLVWRLYHRDSSGTLQTFYEVDLMEALKSQNAEAFKYFWIAFAPDSLARTSGADSLLYKLLN